MLGEGCWTLKWMRGYISKFPHEGCSEVFVRMENLVPVILFLIGYPRELAMYLELELPKELVVVHLVFDVSILKKCMGDPSLIVATENVWIKYSLSYDEIPI